MRSLNASGCFSSSTSPTSRADLASDLEVRQHRSAVSSIGRRCQETGARHRFSQLSDHPASPTERSDPLESCRTRQSYPAGIVTSGRLSFPPVSLREMRTITNVNARFDLKSRSST